MMLSFYLARDIDFCQDTFTAVNNVLLYVGVKIWKRNCYTTPHYGSLFKSTSRNLTVFTVNVDLAT